MHSSGGEDSSSDLRGPSSNGGHNPYGYSTPSLPRYQSQQQLSQPSPLNPSAVRGGSYGPNGGQQQRDGASSSNASSRFSSYGYQGQAGNNAHPLSNAMYMDSSPTLAGSEVMSPDQEKMRLGAADQLGEYIQPHRADTALQTGGNAFGGRRGPLKATGFTALYRGWSGATLADSGKDERHIKLPRLGYLDGIKFVAAWVALNGTLFDAVLGDNDYAFIQRDSPLYITR